MTESYAPYGMVALILSEEEAIRFLSGYEDAHPDTPALSDFYRKAEDLLSEYELRTLSGQDFRMTSLFEDECSSMYFTPFYNKNGQINTDPENFTYEKLENDRLYLIEAEKDCSPLSFLTGKSYANMEELMSEFKDRYSLYVPSDFDWNRHIGYVEYCLYG